MKKQLHEILASYLKEIIPQHKKEVFERRRQTDNVVVWIAGISTGAIALIISQASNISIFASIWLKVTVGFFLLAVLSGVIFRAFIYQFEGIESQSIMGLEGYCHALSLEFSGPMEVTENYTKEEIARKLKEDMGIDYDGWLEKEHLDLNFWIKLYRDWAEFWKKSENEGLRNLGKAFAQAAGKDSAKTEEIFLKVSDNTLELERMNRYKSICDIAYVLLMVFFALAVITIVIGFFLTQVSPQQLSPAAP